MIYRFPHSRIFSPTDVKKFADLSGDYNPIHIDPIAARRTQAGTRVVHGVHAALWALDTLVEVENASASIAKVKVQFHKFIRVGQTVDLDIASKTGNVRNAKVLVDGDVVASVRVTHGAAAGADSALLSRTIVRLDRKPNMLNLSEISGGAGWLPPKDSQEHDRFFSNATALLGWGRIKAIISLSTLVGMVCPGLHSMFSAFDITIAEEREEVAGLSYHVTNVDDRFRLANIEVVGQGIRGVVSAFIRQPPVVQPSLQSLLGRVAGDEFRNTTALIVGGSRGLGALTARIIAAGGGKVTITYAVGKSEAEEIRTEIGAGQCCVIPYDVHDEPVSQLINIGKINQIYYFATPHIVQQKQRIFDRAILDEFISFYVDGFYSLCAALQAQANEPFSAFYPSSVAVDERPRGMTEYAMAKAAGEALCNDLTRFLPKIRVLVRRLPRLLTDQTATVFPVQSEDIIETMVPIIRQMCA